jgi:CheY-like chemotaxis protein
MTAIPKDICYDRLLGPAILLFGEDEARRDALDGVIRQAGGRVVASAPIGEATDRIARQAVIGGVVVDARSDAAGLDALLTALDLHAAAGRAPALVLTASALLDPVAARLADGGTMLLVDPAPDEVTGAIARLLAPRGVMLADGAGETDARLAELREEVGRIARTLASLSDGGTRVGRAMPLPPPSAIVDGPLVRSLIRLRGLRAQHFDRALFADPAWDILLDLAAARLERRAVAISSLCIAAAVPATTALRWITMMTQQRLLVRRPDPDDGRRVFIGLGEGAAAAMEAYLISARRVLVQAG